MSSALDSPFIVFVIALVAQWLAAYVGYALRKRKKPLSKDAHEDLDTVQTAALTSLGAHYRI